MEGGTSGDRLYGALAAVTVVLVASALSLPGQPYTGAVLRGDAVVQVLPGSPAALAGIEAGDLLRPAERGSWSAATSSPLAAARPGVPVILMRDRAGDVARVELTPQPLPSAERRMRAALLAVASGFMLLGGWVWSERRDRLTGPFVLLTLAFSTLVAPAPRLPGSALNILYDLLYTAATLALPALCVHFFALFPEPRNARGSLAQSVHLGYATAGILFALSIVTLALQFVAPAAAPAVLGVLQVAAALWFALGLLGSLTLFARSYLRAGSSDARRRLRVALIGTVLGLGPIAAVVVLRNLSPAREIPGERWAVFVTLLVPLSFAWATIVHRIFDFRVALRAISIAGVLAVAGGVAYLLGERLAAAGALGGLDLGGAALAMIAIGAAIAGPSRPLARAFAARVMALEDRRALADVVADDEDAGADLATRLAHACETVRVMLRLDQCVAIDLSNPAQPRRWARAGLPAGAAGNGRGLDPGEPGLGPRFAAALGTLRGPVAADDAGFESADREALEAAGVRWVLPIGQPAVVAALLLGRRLAGPWLDRRETAELRRLASHLSVALENDALRRAATSHGAFHRELEQASAIQHHLLPRRAPVYPTLDCAAATLSSEAVGGDYYDFVERSPREFTLVVGDAAGKGIPAALLLAGVQARFRAEAAGERDPAVVLRALNHALLRVDQPEKFVGVLCAHVDVARGRLAFANGGLTPPLVRRHDGAFEELTASGVLLGVSLDAEYPVVELQLGAGDVVVFYTDGLTEAQRGEELFGLERVREVMGRLAHRRARDIVEGLLSEVGRFSEGPLDDLTLLVLKQLAEPRAAGLAPAVFPLKRGRAAVDTAK